MNKITSSLVLLGIFSQSVLSENISSEFVQHLESYDKAQSELNIQKSLPYLSENILIEITTCENKIDAFDYNKFVKVYSSIQKNADLLSINRKIREIESCDSGGRCTIHSDLKERLVGYQGRYDKTTLSTDTTNLIKIGDEIKITSISAKIKCN